MAWVKICIFTNIRLTVLWKRPKYLRSFALAYKTYHVVYSIVKITFQSQISGTGSFSKASGLAHWPAFCTRQLRAGAHQPAFLAPDAYRSSLLPRSCTTTTPHLRTNDKNPHSWVLKNSRNFQPQSSPLSSLKLNQLFSLFLVGQKLRIW